MAYPTVDKTYGFKPVNRLDGLPYAGAIRQIPVAAAYATAILNGDTVQVDTNGYIVASTVTSSGNIVGVLVGCQYVNSAGQTVQGQYYPAAASTSTALAFAYVVDDPSAVFKVVATVASNLTVVDPSGNSLVSQAPALAMLPTVAALTVPATAGSVSIANLIALVVGYILKPIAPVTTVQERTVVDKPSIDPLYR